MASALHVLRHMKLRVALSVALCGLVGCADSGAEDGEFDVFLTEDAKTDAFGVEDWSPDGMAVLKLTTTFSAAKLEDDVGLSERAAKSIVAQRKTLADKKFRDLRELDDAKFVGVTVFKQLLRYATREKLYKTAIRIPLVVEGTDRVSITSFNGKAREHGLTAFARYTFVDADTDYDAKALSYDKRLEELATKAGITIDGEMMRFASTVNEYLGGLIKPCYIGDGLEVADVPGSQGDGLMGDMYTIWGWRFRSKKVFDDTFAEDEINFTDDWKTWDTKSTAVLLQSTNTDSGDEPEADIIPACR
jgi:hypothetical protein